MTSLLQFSGTIDCNGVWLEAYKLSELPYDAAHGFPLSDENVRCDTCGSLHPQIYIFRRKPRGLFGPWVVFRVNGRDEVPDLSVAMTLKKIPRDAIKLSPEQNASYWHRR